MRLLVLARHGESTLNVERVVNHDAARHVRLTGRGRDRVADFTELLATAIPNADSRAELAASRARVVAAGDESRRRLERDLHDGAAATPCRLR